MPARFTNLRPAEAKPIDQLRELHTLLYAKGEASAFRDSIIGAGLPAGIALAVARIANPDFVARAEFALRADLHTPQAASPLGGPPFLELARWLARADNRAVRTDVVRGELRTDLISLISATQGVAPGPSTTVVQDDLLSLYLVPGAFGDYRRTLGALLMVTRLVKDSGKGLRELLLPSTGALIDDLHGPWPDNQLPLAWKKLVMGGRILLPAQIGVRNPELGPAPDRSSSLGDVLVSSSFSASDFSQFTDLIATRSPDPIVVTNTRAAVSKKAPKL